MPVKMMYHTIPLSIWDFKGEDYPRLGVEIWETIISVKSVPLKIKVDQAFFSFVINKIKKKQFPVHNFPHFYSYVNI